MVNFTLNKNRNWEDNESKAITEGVLKLKDVLHDGIIDLYKFETMK